MKTHFHVGREVGLHTLTDLSQVCLCSAVVETRFLLWTKAKNKDLEVGVPSCGEINQYKVQLYPDPTHP